MANEEQLKILKQGVKVWNKWREEHPDEKIDLRGAHLVGAHLAGAALGGADLRETNLARAVLFQAHLQGTILQRAILNWADLRGADMAETHLGWATVKEAILVSADLRKADLREAILTEANLREAILTEANLRGAILGGANLIQTDLSHATITGVILYGTARDDWKIDGIKCDYVYWGLGGEHTPKNRNFRPGEFEELYKSLPTFDYYFEHGFTPLDPLIMDRVVLAINERHPEFELKLDSFHSRGQPHARFTVLHKEVLEEAKKQVTTNYEARIAALEGKQEQLMELVSTLINKPQYIGRDYIAISENAQVNQLTTGNSKDEAVRGK